MKKLTALLTMLCAFGLTASAQTQKVSANPYLPLWEHVPDGEPRLFEDPDNPGKYRIYIIGSHDVRFGSYCGPDIRAWSAPAEDLSDWRDEGPIFTYQVDGKWDVMFAPDLVEIKNKEGKNEYYLFPHVNGGGSRINFVAKSDRPNGPFKVLNATEDGKGSLPGSMFGFDPSVFVEKVTDPSDPDYARGFRAYGFWGFQHVDAAELDPETMYSVRPGTEIINGFIPSSVRYGQLNPREKTDNLRVFPGEDLGTFNFFEASSIRKVGNKYVWIFSGHSGPDYGQGSSNSTLRYAYGDTPLGPWKSGGVLVDSRGIVPNQDGSRLVSSNSAHNTHGSIEQIGDQWYCFYHRPPRGFGFARQAVVAPITIEYDQQSVADGGAVRIRAYNPYAPDGKWECKASNGDEYKGAEVTSEGFNLYGLPPYQYYSAGYACYFSDNRLLQDSWDVWDNHMTVGTVQNGNIVGFKYFGFGGLDMAKKGLKPFAGTKPGNDTKFELFLTPKTAESFKVQVWMDGPWDNDVWHGRQLGTITVPANSKQEATRFTLDVSSVVDELDGKHAIYLVAEGSEGTKLFDMMGLGFSNKEQSISMPVVPQMTIKVGGKTVEIPDTPIRSTKENGLVDASHYAVSAPTASAKAPKVVATANNPEVAIKVTQAKTTADKAIVEATYNGKTKTFEVSFK